MADAQVRKCTKKGARVFNLLYGPSVIAEYRVSFGQGCDERGVAFKARAEHQSNDWRWRGSGQFVQCGQKRATAETNLDAGGQGAPGMSPRPQVLIAETINDEGEETCALR